MAFSNKRGPAHTALQNFENDRRLYPEELSLHRFWRAAGSPQEKTPSLWLALAHHLVEGFAGYQNTLCRYAIPEEPDEDEISMRGEMMIGPDSMTRVNSPERIQLAKQFGDQYPWEPGDTLAGPELAFLYCMFLDGLGEASVFHYREETEKSKKPKNAKKPRRQPDPEGEPVIKMPRLTD